MTDYTQPQTFPDQTAAMKDLQGDGYRLWQWLDHVTTVWWGPGRNRILLRPAPDGTFRAIALPGLNMEDAGQNVGTVANVASVKTLDPG